MLVTVFFNHSLGIPAQANSSHNIARTRMSKLRATILDAPLAQECSYTNKADTEFIEWQTVYPYTVNREPKI